MSWRTGTRQRGTSKTPRSGGSCSRCPAVRTFGSFRKAGTTRSSEKDALDATIAEFQAGWPDGVDVRVELTTPVDSHHGFGRGGFVWIFGDERGYGTDFAELGEDGRMKTIVVFSDAGPPPSPSDEA